MKAEDGMIREKKGASVSGIERLGRTANKKKASRHICALKCHITPMIQYANSKTYKGYVICSAGNVPDRASVVLQLAKVLLYSNFKSTGGKIVFSF